MKERLSNSIEIPSSYKLEDNQEILTKKLNENELFLCKKLLCNQLTAILSVIYSNNQKDIETLKELFDLLEEPKDLFTYLNSKEHLLIFAYFIALICYTKKSFQKQKENY